MGLIEISRDSENGQIGCMLTDKGRQVFNLDLIERQKKFVKKIVCHSAFKNTLKLYLYKGEVPSKENIVEIMKRSNLFNVESDSTYFRRASTIIGWTNWIINQIE